MKRLMILSLFAALTTSLVAGSKQEQVAPEAQTQPVYREVSAEQAADMIRDPDVYILDVRTESEYAAGHIENANLIPVQDLASRISEISEYKDSEVLVYCRSGNRSTTASRILLDAGFTNISNLQRGIVGWAGQRLPITTE